MGHKYANSVRDLALSIGALSVLDYGCGKQTLRAALPEYLPFDWFQYDPAIPEFEAEPDPADLVVCTDVLEHIEPECLQPVLDHMRSLTQKATFIVIHTGKASKTLPDGRNAHLIQEGPRWWLNALDDRWTLDSLFYQDGHLHIAGRPQ